MAYDTTQLDSVLQGLQGQLQKPQGVLGQLDPMKLALAQGFFAPTKTGGFGESVSNALGSLQSPLKTMADQNSSIQDKILQIKLAQAKLAGRSPEDAEEARDNRQRRYMDHQALESQIRDTTNDRKRYEEGTPEYKQRTDEIAQLRAQQATLTGRQMPKPESSPPVVSGVPTIKNDAGEVMVLKDRKWVKQ
jgi:chromosome segregation ATPase